MDMFNDAFEFIESEGHLFSTEATDNNDINDEINDILLTRPSTIQQSQSSPLRPIDLPSHRKHYGLLTFCTYRIPILFRFVVELFFGIFIYFVFFLLV
jgi:hypothetical protein